jgi:hypothetical protein
MISKKVGIRKVEGPQNWKIGTRVRPEESAVEKLCQAIGKVKATVNELRIKLEEFEREMIKEVSKSSEMS